jgi:hypothetical protein
MINEVLYVFAKSFYGEVMGKELCVFEGDFIGPLNEA